jgi:hypothetical protein
LESLNGKDNLGELGVDMRFNIKTNLTEIGSKDVDWVKLSIIALPLQN